MRVGWITSSAVALAAVSVVLAACGGSDNNNGNSGGAASKGSSSPTIALLLPETKTTRYEEQDKPRFEAKVKACARPARSSTRTPTRTPRTQQQQAEAAITNGAKVLVLDAVDAGPAAAMVDRGQAVEHPGDRLRPADLRAPIAYYVSFDNVRVGKLQAQALVDKLEADGDGKGTIVMLNGSPTDPTPGDTRRARTSVLDTSGDQDRQRVRHARLEPGQGPAGDGAGDHRARQGQDRRASTPPTTAWPAARSRP